jgi:hypothetical protein
MRPGFSGAALRLGRDLADFAQQLLGEFPTRRIVDLERLLGGLNQRPSDTASPEDWCEIAELSDRHCCVETNRAGGPARRPVSGSDRTGEGARNRHPRN